MLNVNTPAFAPDVEQTNHRNGSYKQASRRSGRNKPERSTNADMKRAGGGPGNATMAASEAVSLRVMSGVPIVEVFGEWAPGVMDSLTKMIGALAEAGHYEIVVNVKRAEISGIDALGSLAGVVRLVRSHCGHVDIVGTADQLRTLVVQQGERSFRLSGSVETAIGRIKRIPVLELGDWTTATPA